MAKFRLLLSLALTAITINHSVEEALDEHDKVNEIPIPPIDLNEWWGPGDGKGQHDTSIRNFTIQFKESMITDLKYRLLNHQKFVPPLEGTAFTYGFNSTAMDFWVDYLANKYPFQEREKFLNKYPHYITNIQGLNIHFMRIKSQKTSLTLVPLLLLHGWTGSIREFYETIPYLISIAESKGMALDLIIPSLPGFGFSDAAVRVGLGTDKAAVIFSNLMHRVGYKQYYVQGGDMGAVTGSIMATYFQDEVLGYHTNLPFFFNPEIIFRLIIGNWDRDHITTPDLQNRLYPSLDKFFGILDFSGYLHIQATRPDTVGIGLTDSPTGLMAYIMEKMAPLFRAKFINYPDGGLTQILTAEQLMDNIMIYWSTRTITTSMRLYAETFNKRFVALRIFEIVSRVPLWVLEAPDDLVYLPNWLIKKKFPNLLGATLPSVGGHYYAWEQPQPFAQDVVNAIVQFREWHAQNSTLYSQCSMYIDN